jgi:hypothetical protein
MSYASGGLIQATDYNNLAWGGTQGTYTAVTKNVAYVMGVGTGTYGYGQDLSQINTVAASGTVTAAQWAGFLYLLNRAAGHQYGLAGQVSTSGNLNMTAGETITYFANITSAVTTINNNPLAYNAQGSTTTGTNFDAAVSSTTGLSSYTVDRVVTFASAQHARYFFNAGGQLNFVMQAINSADSGAENSFSRLVSGIGGINFKATDNGGRTGSGITLNTNLTTHGYFDNAFNAPTTVVQVTDTTTSYTASTALLQCYYGGTNDTTNGAKGAVVVFRTVFTIADKTWDDTLSLTYRTRVDIVYPESTYLTSSWGTPTVS